MTSNYFRQYIAGYSRKFLTLLNQTWHFKIKCIRINVGLPLVYMGQLMRDWYLGLNEMYVWFLLPTYPNFFNPTLNIKMVFGEKIPKMGTFSDFVTIFFVKCYNKI